MTCDLARGSGAHLQVRNLPEDVPPGTIEPLELQHSRAVQPGKTLPSPVEGGASDPQLTISRSSRSSDEPEAGHTNVIRVLHLITGLRLGGAEMMLYKLVSQSSGTRVRHVVVSMLDMGKIGAPIASSGVPVYTLDITSGTRLLGGVRQLHEIIRRERPHVLQTWMYHANLLGGIAGKLAGNATIVWGIRQEALDPRVTKRSIRWISRVSAALSAWLPATIVCCSEASLRSHASAGYAREKMIVIPNGFDLSAFKEDPEARSHVREELGLDAGAPLIGLVARFHPQKDHANFVKAAALLHKQISQVHFLLCGDGVTWENRELAEWIDDAGVRSNFHLLGRRNDIPRLDAALDIASLSSRMEGFPNVVGEAMACGVPCVVTDVGDAAEIVGDAGSVVPAGDPAALAGAWQRLLAAGPEVRRQLGLAARKRVEEQFSLPRVIATYEALYSNLTNGAGR